MKYFKIYIYKKNISCDFQPQYLPFFIKFFIRFHSQVLSEIHNKYSYTAGLWFYKNKSKGKKIIMLYT